MKKWIKIALCAAVALPVIGFTVENSSNQDQGEYYQIGRYHDGSYQRGDRGMNRNGHRGRRMHEGRYGERSGREKYEGGRYGGRKNLSCCHSQSFEQRQDRLDFKKEKLTIEQNLYKLEQELYQANKENKDLNAITKKILEEREKLDQLESEFYDKRALSYNSK